MMNTVYNCYISAGLSPPQPIFDDGRGVYFAVEVNFRHVFGSNHHANYSPFPPILRAATTVVPRHAFLAAPAAVTHDILSASGVAVPPSVLDAFAPHMSSFAWSSAAASAAIRILPLCVVVVAETYYPLTYCYGRYYNVALSCPAPLTYPTALTYHPNFREEPEIEAVTELPTTSYNYDGDDEEDETALASEEAFGSAVVPLTQSTAEAAEIEDASGSANAVANEDGAFEEFFSSPESDKDDDEVDSEPDSLRFEEFFSSNGSDEEDEDEDEDEDEYEDEDEDDGVGGYEDIEEFSNIEARDATRPATPTRPGLEDHQYSSNERLIDGDHHRRDNDGDGKDDAEDRNEESSGSITEDTSSTTTQTQTSILSKEQLLSLNMEDDHQSDESSDRENDGGGEDEALRRSVWFNPSVQTETTVWDEFISSLRSSMSDALSSRSLRLDGHDHGNSINHDDHDHEHDDQIDDDEDDDQIDDDDDDDQIDDEDDDDYEEFTLSVVPATKSSIEALEEVTTTTSPTKGQCSVCMDDFSSPIQSNGHDYLAHDHDHDDQNKMDAVVRMPCSHLYHKECIVQWLEKSHLCPLCRYAMPTSNL